MTKKENKQEGLEGDSGSSSLCKLTNLQTVSDMVTLKNIDLKVKVGEFVAIIGDCGAGKSSLMQALVGDLLVCPSYFLENMPEDVRLSEKLDKHFNEFRAKFFDVQSCPVIFNGSLMQECKRRYEQGESPLWCSRSIAYCPQSPWIMNKTIRDNILFGRAYIEEKYN